jgi:tRNA(Ile)-lysidine synthase
MSPGGTYNKNAEWALLKRVAKTILRYNMFHPGQPLGVAVSGGADSTALLHLLTELASDWKLPLTVLHLNHHLRGNDSDQDAFFVQQVATRLDLPCLVEHASLDPSAGNLEEAARHARYDFFGRAMRQHSLARIAVGHTLSDQAETVLFRAIRGAGITGLAGIWPVTPEGIVRPLIELTRDEVEAWLQEHRIHWREDSSNRDRRFARNRIRHDLLPVLRQDWNPGVDQALGRLAELCQDEEQYWVETAAALLDQCGAGLWPAVASPGRLPTSQHEVLILDTTRLRALHVAALRRVLREAIRRVRDDSRPVDFEHLEKLVNLVRRTRGSGRVNLPGLSICRSFDRLRLARTTAPPKPYELELPVPGEVRLPDGTFLAATLEPEPPDSRYNTSAGVLDRDRAPGKLALRSWTPGAIFWPAGQPHEIKLKSLFQQARVPSWERAEWPILACGKSVIWARGFGAAQGFAPTGSSRNVMRLWECVR